MKNLSLGAELTKNEQKSVLGGGWALCNDGVQIYGTNCSGGASYCSFHGGLRNCAN